MKLRFLTHLVYQHYHFHFSRGVLQLSNYFNQCNYAFRIFFFNLFKRVPFKPTSIQFNRSGNKNYGPFLMLAGLNYNFWYDKGIQEEDIKKTIEDFECIYNSKLTNNGDISAKYSLTHDNWEPVIVKNNFQVWRKRLDNSSLYQYKVFGTFEDIPAQAFFDVQRDTEYRKRWDGLVIKLDIVDREKVNDNSNKSSILSNKKNKSENENENENDNDNDNDNNNEVEADFENKKEKKKDYLDSGNEVIHWIMHYPFPMYSRDYCYIRRSIIDHVNNLMILVSKAVDHPKCVTSDQYVRVADYQSQMVIRPHTKFNEKGFDYMLTYFDDPRSGIPVPAYNWMAASGVPNFVDSLHQAALKLQSCV